MSDPITKFKNILLEAHMQNGGTITKLEANYTDRSSDQNKCRGCKHFQSPDKCDLVEGLISPNGWCKYFSSKESSEVK